MVKNKFSAASMKRGSHVQVAHSDGQANNNEHESVLLTFIKRESQQHYWSDRDVSALLQSGAEVDLTATDV
jgi:hypothetical protein